MSRVFENYYTPSCKITSYPGLYEDRRPPHLQVEAVLSPTSEILLDHNTTVSQFVGSKFLQICHLQLETKSHNTASERLHQRVVRLVPRPTDIFLRARLSQLELQTSQAVSSAKSIANLLSKYPLLKPKVRETVGKESNSSDSTIEMHFEINLFENNFTM